VLTSGPAVAPPSSSRWRSKLFPALLGKPCNVLGDLIRGLCGLGNVKPPRLIYTPDPVYPLLARQTHISGIVVIEAVIDEQGKVTGMRFISGYPPLIPAALSAVSNRRYEPTILDGEPMPIDLRVEINFSFT